MPTVAQPMVSSAPPTVRPISSRPRRVRVVTAWVSS